MNLPLPNLLALQARLAWIKTARPNQLTPNGDWRVWLALAGRGWGKTRCGAEDLAYYALWHPGARLAIVAPTHADARDTCMEGASGLLSVLPPPCVKTWHRSHGALTLHNGSRVKLFSADRPDRLRGPQHHRVWCDELGAWDKPEAFDQLMFGLRLGLRPKLIVTTTPRPTELLRQLVARAGQDVVLTRGHTAENGANLAPGIVAALQERYAGTRIGRQELAAEMLDLTEGALWTQPSLDCVVTAVPQMRRVLVAVDPALHGQGGGDETGIVAAGQGADGLYYVLADRSGHYPGDIWAARAAQLAVEMRAEKIRIEVNAGGALLTRIVQHYAAVPCEPVHAVHGKWDRAVPVAALYEQRRVRHLGPMPELREQMLRFTPDYIARHSPDRVDALVWALAGLLEQPVPAAPGIRTLL